MSEHEQPFISVVIPTHNRRDMLERALEGLAQQSYPEHLYEVVVVDDGSTDGTTEFLKGFSLPHLPLRCVFSEAHGPAHARNLGTQEAKGQVILFTGDDCLPDPDLLKQHDRRHRAEEGIAVLGYVDWHPEAGLSPLMSLLAMGDQTGYPLVDNENQLAPAFFYTSNVSARREHLLQVGGFDEGFPYAAFEDIDLGIRLEQAGVRLVLERAAIAYHHHRHTWRSIAGRQRVVGRAAVTLNRKHPTYRGLPSLEGVADPKFFLNFARSHLHYWYLQGVMEELTGKPSPAGEEDELDLDAATTPGVTLGRWMNAMVEGEREQTRHWHAEAQRLHQEAQQRHEELKQAHESLQQVRAEFEQLEAFAQRVRGALPFRLLNAIKRILRPGRPSA